MATNRSRPFLAAILAAVLGAAASAASAPSSAAGLAAGGPGKSPSLFGTRETRSASIAMFPKWNGVLARYFSERRLAEEPCTATAFNRCHLREWAAFLEDIRDHGRREQVEAVNAYMNRQPYLTDPRNYGVSDYWATPVQFFTRDGDCEDYAIAKFLSLRALGFDNDMLRIVVVQDMNLRVGHAILVVYLDGEPLVLDNQIRRTVRAGAVHHYRPIYSINEKHWWLHQRG